MDDAISVVADVGIADFDKVTGVNDIIKLLRKAVNDANTGLHDSGPFPRTLLGIKGAFVIGKHIKNGVLTSPWLYVYRLQERIVTGRSGLGTKSVAFTHICALCAARKPATWRMHADHGGALLTYTGEGSGCANFNRHLRRQHERSAPLIYMAAGRRRVREIKQRKQHQSTLVALFKPEPKIPKGMSMTWMDMSQPEQKHFKMVFSQALYTNTVTPETFVGCPHMQEALEALRPGTPVPSVEEQREVLITDLAELRAFQRQEWGLLSVYHNNAPFLHLYDDIWTDGKGSSILGVTVSWNGFPPSMSMAHVEAELEAGRKPGPLQFKRRALFYLVMEGGHGAEEVAAAMKAKFLSTHGEDLMMYVCTRGSDTTGGARKVAVVLGQGENNDCCMHLGSLVLQFGLFKDNIRNLTPPGGSSKVAVCVTPGFCETGICVAGCAHGACGPHCISFHRAGVYCQHGGFDPAAPTPASLARRWTALVKVLKTGKLMKALNVIQDENTYIKVTPGLAGDTRILSKGKQARQLLASIFPLRELHQVNTEAMGAVALTRNEWQRTAEVEAMIHVVDKFNTTVQTTSSAIGPFTFRLLSRLASDIRASHLMVVNIEKPVWKGTPLHSLPRVPVPWGRIEFPAVRHSANRMAAQMQVRFGNPREMQLLATLSDPRTKSDFWDTDMQPGLDVVFKKELPVIQHQADMVLKAAMHVEFRRVHKISGQPHQQQPAVEAAEDLSYLWGSHGRAAGIAAVPSPDGAAGAPEDEDSAVNGEFKRWKEYNMILDLIRASKFAPPYAIRDETNYADCDTASKRHAKQLHMMRANKEALHMCMYKFDVAAFMSKPAYQRTWPLISEIALQTGAALPACAIIEGFFSITGLVDHHRRRGQRDDGREAEVLMKHALADLKAQRKAAAIDLHKA